MVRPSLCIDVASKDRKTLVDLLSAGVRQVPVVLRAVALSQLAEGVSAPRISSVIPLTPQAIRKIGHRHEQGGLEHALYERQRPGAEEVLNASQKQRIIAMVCSDPPEGRARWTVRLTVEQAVKRKLVPRVGRAMPRVMNVDESPASPAAVEVLKAKGSIPRRVALRQCKYLNNVIEQDHRAVKQRGWLAKGYGSFQSAWRTL